MSSDFRLRINYRKADRGAFLSHLEVLHTVERIVRRAQLPYAITQGFHPHMKVAFGPALSVGTASDGEYLDLWLSEFVRPDIALAKLKASAPRVLPIERVGYIGNKLPSLTAAITIHAYRAEIWARDIEIDKVEQSFQSVRKSTSLEVVQKDKKKVFNPALCIPKDAVVTKNEEGCTIDFSLRIDQTGALRPEILLQEVCNRAGQTYSHLELVRTGLFIEEDGVWVRPM
ncbi:MAG: DUF2344 domain-containing protein [Coriobacteriia bacterium]|nr:DUF2344 domain-containing protein [Coriobacteriia bacterium]